MDILDTGIATDNYAGQCGSRGSFADEDPRTQPPEPEQEYWESPSEEACMDLAATNAAARLMALGATAVQHTGSRCSLHAFGGKPELATRHSFVVVMAPGHTLVGMGETMALAEADVVGKLLAWRAARAAAAEVRVA